MKAIETRYAGCRFRSRIEARWAVCFDALGLQWTYEKQGYKLPSGWYLPDFEITGPKGVKHWVEVKGTFPNERELTLFGELRATLNVNSQNSFSLLYGDVVRPDSRFSVTYGRGCIMTSGPGVPITVKTGPYSWSDTDPRMHLIWMLGGIPDPEDLDEMLRNALTAARSARFEHGQSG